MDPDPIVVGEPVGLHILTETALLLAQAENTMFALISEFDNAPTTLSPSAAAGIGDVHTMHEPGLILLLKLTLTTKEM